MHKRAPAIADAPLPPPPGVCAVGPVPPAPGAHNPQHGQHGGGAGGGECACAFKRVGGWQPQSHKHKHTQRPPHTPNNHLPSQVRQDEFGFTGAPGEAFATIERALDERTIGHNPERLSLMKVCVP